MIERIRYRKRNLLIERKSNSYKSYIVSDANLTTIPRCYETYFENRFSVELENDFLEEFVESYKINSFNVIEDAKKGCFLNVEPLLNVGEWVDLFKNMTIARIKFFDAFGNVVKLFDYDIVFLKSEFKGDFKNNNIMFPKIYYKILG